MSPNDNLSFCTFILIWIYYCQHLTILTMFTQFYTKINAENMSVDYDSSSTLKSERSAKYWDFLLSLKRDPKNQLNPPSYFLEGLLYNPNIKVHTTPHTFYTHILYLYTKDMQCVCMTNNSKTNTKTCSSAILKGDARRRQQETNKVILLMWRPVL